jgi:phenol 2-monooxygenase (NADPH)
MYQCQAKRAGIWSSRWLAAKNASSLKSLGLAEEILTEGCQMWEIAFWNPGRTSTKEEGAVIERASIVRDVAVPVRFPLEITFIRGESNESLRMTLDDTLAEGSRGRVASQTSLLMKTGTPSIQFSPRLKAQMA